jgi:hypothetical protein
MWQLVLALAILAKLAPGDLRFFFLLTPKKAPAAAAAPPQPTARARLVSGLEGKTGCLAFFPLHLVLISQCMAAGLVNGQLNQQSTG